MSKSRKENKVDIITKILITKHIIRHIVPTDQVKIIHVLKKILVILLFDVKLVLVCCCMLHGEPLWWTGLV